MLFPLPAHESRALPTRDALRLLAACIVITGCAAMLVARKPFANFSTAAQGDETKLNVKAEGEGNQLRVKTEGESVIVDVHSRSGIGSATIEPAAGTLPKQIVLRLHLKGLEEFRLSYGQTVITARVSSGDGIQVVQSVATRNGGERTITAASPSWLNLRIVSDQAASRIPLEDGYFEIKLPANFPRRGRRVFSIRWIDFYR